MASDTETPAIGPDAIAARLDSVRAEIAEAARAVGRDPETVRLIAVSKKQPVAKLRAALEAGHRDFGENRVQEAQGKFPDLRPTHADLRLHLVGPLQTNKAADAVALFDWIHTVDRAKLARVLAKALAGVASPPKLLVQVNTGEEAQKSGVAPTEAEPFVRWCQQELGLAIAGLMAIPPVDADPTPHFALLAELAQALDLPELSMGMSGDFDQAVRLGATQVRVGSAVFGPRD
jgi:pyridoxal phosphate enzyme (YggS family)